MQNRHCSSHPRTQPHSTAPATLPSTHSNSQQSPKTMHQNSAQLSRFKASRTKRLQQIVSSRVQRRFCLIASLDVSCCCPHTSFMQRTRAQQPSSHAPIPVELNGNSKNTHGSSNPQYYSCVFNTNMQETTQQRKQCITQPKNKWKVQVINEKPSIATKVKINKVNPGIISTAAAQREKESEVLN